MGSWFGTQAVVQNVIAIQAKKKKVVLNSTLFNDESKKKFHGYNAYNYAIIGKSGAGKSSYVNTLFLLKKSDPNAAKTGIVETTGITSGIKSFEFPQTSYNSPRILFWDLPGWGTTTYPLNEYFDIMALPLFRGIILISSGRFEESDVKFFKQTRSELRKLLKESGHYNGNIDKAHVPVYLVRTKFDRDFEEKIEEAREQKEKNQKLTHNEFIAVYKQTIDELRNDCKMQFGDEFDDIGLRHCFYIVSSKWKNRMLTNDENDIQSGWIGLKRRMWLDTVYLNPELHDYRRKEKEDAIDKEIFELMQSENDLTMSDLYAKHCYGENTFTQAQLAAAALFALLMGGGTVGVLKQYQYI